MPATEKAARFDTGHADEKFLMVNESKTNGVGTRVGYELLYANHAKLLLDPEDSRLGAPSSQTLTYG